jgi:hypothetical protein
MEPGIVQSRGAGQRGEPGSHVRFHRLDFRGDGLSRGLRRREACHLVEQELTVDGALQRRRLRILSRPRVNEPEIQRRAHIGHRHCVLADPGEHTIDQLLAVGSNGEIQQAERRMHTHRTPNPQRQDGTLQT